jgi:glyoxylase-like metal-dependent hydrolase (beta-lactamase superfamily II)
VQETFKPVFNLDGLKTDGSQFNLLFKDQEVVKLSNHLTMTALHTPGHTADSTAYHIHHCGIFLGIHF